MTLPAKYTALIESGSYREVLPELIRQVKKDFEMTGIVFDIEPEASPETLVATLSKKVSELIDKDYASFANLMYRIDVPEQKLMAIRTRDLDTLIAEITQLILEKEWQKVWFRLKSKN